MKDEIIIKIIDFLDSKKPLHKNPIHLIFFMILTSPVIILYWEIHPIPVSIFMLSLFMKLPLFLLKLLVKDKYQNEIDDVKNSIPTFGSIKGFNSFHFVMFLLIAAPLLFMFYGIILAIFD